MQINYQPKSQLEKFGQKVINLLVDNFPQTFYVGGMVRDLLLEKPITDIDIATEARPDQVAKILSAHNILADQIHKNFGVIIAKNGELSIEVATFRRDQYIKSRYPKIALVKTPKQDSQRRDFSINALYLSGKTNKILDFHSGLADLELKQLRFIGKPVSRIKQDPLRIVRALRFAKILNLKLESGTKKSIKNNFFLIKRLTQSKIRAELEKIKNAQQKKSVRKMLDEQNLLDIK